MARRNLKWQFKNAIEVNFKEKMDKHSIKKSGEMNGIRIFSYAERKNLINLSSQLASFAKQNYNLNFVKDINSTHIQAFLNEKAKECSQNTLNQYESRIKKLERLVNATYSKANADYSGFVVPKSQKGAKGKRDKSMSEEDFLKLRKAFKGSNSCGRIAIEIARIAGLRVEEISSLRANDIDLFSEKFGGIKVINGKGGRERYVKIQNEADYRILESIWSWHKYDERICPSNPDSINKSVRRFMKKAEIDKKYENTTIHAIRKMFAQNQYDYYRNQGFNQKEALDKVSDMLGHGENRDKLMEKYVKNIW